MKTHGKPKNLHLHGKRHVFAECFVKSSAPRAVYAFTMTLMASALICMAMASGSSSSVNVCVMIGAI